LIFTAHQFGSSVCFSSVRSLLNLYQSKQKKHFSYLIQQLKKNKQGQIRSGTIVAIYIPYETKES